MGYTSSYYLAANAVVLVPGEYQISIAKYLMGYLPTYVTFKKDRLNIFRVRVFTSSGSTGNDVISPNTSFGDIINT